ncbi:phosphoribosylanthranilate isomerase [Campylobacter upsaliensis]|uniref:phosphoribosylanthranilate isomerase n=1 Tax=Campylobacter upsaliensis TaxID=28080 RepID=UPI0002E28414|nr:phosphoribosylanthranilate isomerase [Campylobacter upsaliensis]MCR2107381.1 phosphoribosylanthranilate isomerase [Campylobacter upsaliensis]MCR2114737.1 phosphoribosylanthranilate isomerase [Campylobacter upsaliensis]MCR2120149.1 phosphoribosylanthranilate isomerase [Campylobacter upsaliensis]MCR2121659.1 phosphoribosylanthranilate isomerase [Campylobacter upsaliensis]MCR2123597.1 phosphoribosylanthranilate isomerase [Campylobacter upsaliensis]
MTKLKICGIKDILNAEQISGLEQINYLGLIFAQSVRKVDEKTAIKLSQIIHKNHKKVVGVFVDEGLEVILKIAQNAELDGVQIHRRIAQKDFEILQKNKLFVWQVISVGENLQMPSQIYADMTLFDTKGQFKGGNGISFDWNLLKDYKQKFGIAGGIGMHNIREAKALNPTLIDVNSKVENSQGLKELAKIKDLIKEFQK